MLTKYASFQVLAARIAHAGDPLMRTAHRVEFEYEPKPGFLYVRSRAISSRCNDNYDEFPAEEIKAAYRTFIGKPVFVNHHNANHRRARGVIIDAALHEDVNPDGTPDTWVEVLMEIDAIRFPKLAEAIVKGHIERTSMGTDVAYSVCSACGNKAASPVDYCQHIPRMKGKRIYRTTASGEKEGVLVREICYGLGFFENSLLVEEPADPTAFFLGVDTRGLEMAGVKTASRKTAKDPRFKGVGLKQDDDGEWYVTTHRARSDSYPTPEDIPDSVIAEIEATGMRTTASRKVAAKEFTAAGLIAQFGDMPTAIAADIALALTDAAALAERGDYRGSWETLVVRAASLTGQGNSVGLEKVREAIYQQADRVRAKFAAKTAETTMTFDQDGRRSAPAEVDTLRDEQCPVCGEVDAYDGEECPVCGFIKPPSEFGDPDLSKAQQIDLRQDAEEAEGNRLVCDSCGATYVGGTKVAVVLDKERGADEGTDVAYAAGDTCPDCGQGTLQVQGSDPEVDPLAGVQVDEDGFAPAGSANQEEPDTEDDSASDDEDDEDRDEDKPPFPKKKPTAARRGSDSTRRSTVEMARPALEALKSQQREITALKRALVTIAGLAGLANHPHVAALVKRAEDENPAQPDGWATSPSGSEAPAATTSEAETPAATDSPEAIGSSPLTDVSPDATTSVTSQGEDVPAPLDLNEQDPTQPVAGTEDLGEGARGQAGSGRTETEVRVGDPNDPQTAFDDPGFLNTAQARTIASLRLARLQIQAGIATADDDIVLSQKIASSDATDAAIAAQIDTLEKVVAVRQAEASTRPVSRRLVPQARTATREVPSLSGGIKALGSVEVSTPVSGEEMLFE